MTEIDLHRISFRLNFIENVALKQHIRIKEGNLASLEPEVALLAANIGDLTNTIREFISLNFQKEQGVAPPPNPQAQGSETAEVKEFPPESPRSG